ncbi:MAG: glycosyltransferase family 4 protein [Deltaproteobacteria bacterium]|nr:glycosyltransferase family 4 protein [Deltaproteobacteria bacterium]
MKICILTSVHYPFDTRIFHKEAKSLLKAGYDVALIAQHDKDEIVEGIRIVPLPKPRNRIERMTRTVWQVYRKALKIDADIYHFHDPELMPLGLLLKLQRKKVIYDIHENVPKQIKNKQWIYHWCRDIISKIICCVERFCLLGIPVIFAEDSYRNDYFWIKQYTTVLNMPLINQLFYLKNVAQKTVGDSVGYIGGVSEERGSLVTIEALRILKAQGVELRFECVGPIEKSHERQLFKLCGKYNLHNVVFHGRMLAYEGWPVIAQCDMGLAVLHPTPNYVESYPTKIFEYMAMGLPVIASNFKLYRKIVEGSECGICVDPLDPEEISGAIRWIIEHPFEARRMGENGRRAVEEKYNWDKESEKLLALYRNLYNQRA